MMLQLKPIDDRLLICALKYPMGELDWTEPRNAWQTQENVLGRILGHCCRERSLVWHIRDVHGSWGTY